MEAGVSGGFFGRYDRAVAWEAVTQLVYGR